jgi:hypothetical protein
VRALDQHGCNAVDAEAWFRRGDPLATTRGLIRHIHNSELGPSDTLFIGAADLDFHNVPLPGELVFVIPHRPELNRRRALAAAANPARANQRDNFRVMLNYAMTHNHHIIQGYGDIIDMAGNVTLELFQSQFAPLDHAGQLERVVALLMKDASLPHFEQYEENPLFYFACAMVVREVRTKMGKLMKTFANEKAVEREARNILFEHKCTRPIAGVMIMMCTKMYYIKSNMDLTFGDICDSKTFNFAKRHPNRTLNPIRASSWWLGYWRSALRPRHIEEEE